MMSGSNPTSFFTTDDNDWFRPTSHSRGPWDPQACHAGPPTALLARALELLVAEQRLCRITVDLVRPVPFVGFRIDSELVRQGRTVSTGQAKLIDDSGKVCAVAAGLFMTRKSLPDVPTHNKNMGLPEDAHVGPFPFKKSLHGLPAFNGDGVVVRYPDGQCAEPGPTAVWMRTVSILDGETPSPFQKICPLADCGNAFARNAEPFEFSFINADLTVVLHRDPEGEWLGSQSVGYWESDGIGMSDAQLFDYRGAVGRAVQTLVIRSSQD